MRLPALKSIEAQNAYPAQSDGGFAGDIHSSLHKALVAWEKKRGLDKTFKYGRGGTGLFRKEKDATATRSEISWNSGPEKKQPAKFSVPRERTDAEKSARREYMRGKRLNETSEDREHRLRQRREAYLAKNGGVRKKRPKMSKEERKEARKLAKKKYQERVKAGLAQKKIPKKQRSPEQLAKAALRQKRYINS